METRECHLSKTEECLLSRCSNACLREFLGPSRATPPPGHSWLWLLLLLISSLVVSCYPHVRSEASLSRQAKNIPLGARSCSGMTKHSIGLFSYQPRTGWFGFPSWLHQRRSGRVRAKLQTRPFEFNTHTFIRRGGKSRPSSLTTARCTVLVNRGRLSPYGPTA